MEIAVRGRGVSVAGGGGVAPGGGPRAAAAPAPEPLPSGQIQDLVGPGPGRARESVPGNTLAAFDGLTGGKAVATPALRSTGAGNGGAPALSALADASTSRHFLASTPGSPASSLSAVTASLTGGPAPDHLEPVTPGSPGDSLSGPDAPGLPGQAASSLAAAARTPSRLALAAVAGTPGTASGGSAVEDGGGEIELADLAGAAVGAPGASRGVAPAESQVADAAAGVPPSGALEPARALPRVPEITGGRAAARSVRENVRENVRVDGSRALARARAAAPAGLELLSPGAVSHFSLLKANATAERRPLSRLEKLEMALHAGAGLAQHGCAIGAAVLGGIAIAAGVGFPPLGLTLLSVALVVGGVRMAMTAYRGGQLWAKARRSTPGWRGCMRARMSRPRWRGAWHWPRSPRVRWAVSA